MSPNHPHHSGVFFRKIPFFLKVCVRKHGKLDLGGTPQFFLFSFRICPGIHSKDNPFLPIFVETIELLRKSFHLQSNIMEMKKVSLTLNPLGMPMHWQGRKSPLADKSDNEHTITRSPDEFNIGDLGYIKRYSLSTWDWKWEDGFRIIKFPIPYNAGEHWHIHKCYCRTLTCCKSSRHPKKLKMLQTMIGEEKQSF